MDAEQEVRRQDGAETTREGDGFQQAVGGRTAVPRLIGGGLLCHE
ncbi:hypothetical protein [Natronomonas sp. CBA1123]|nr:hypothetical protein [Natronomonas sp. CBA1123]